jgi:hypothetical protein
VVVQVVVEAVVATAMTVAEDAAAIPETNTRAHPEFKTV